MPNPVISSLMVRRAELLADAKVAEAAWRRILDDIAHLDGAIRTFDPAHRPAKLRTVPLPHTGRGVLAILRDAKGPMLVRDIAVRLVASQGREPKDRKLVRIAIGTVRNVLCRYRRDGLVRPMPGDGQAVLWELIK